MDRSYASGNSPAKAWASVFTQTLHYLFTLLRAPSALALMRSLVKDASRISSLCSAGSLARLGRCHYHSNNIPIIKTMDDETLVKVNFGIGWQVELRYAKWSNPNMKTPWPTDTAAVFVNLQGRKRIAL